MKKTLPILLSVLLSCTQISKENTAQTSLSLIKNGHWLFSLDIGAETLPFNAFFSNKNDQNLFVFKNADEVISINDVTIGADSVFIRLPLFGTTLKGKVISDSLIKGYWFNTTKGEDYKIPFTGQFGIEQRFELTNSVEEVDFSGKWEVTFSPEGEHSCKALGVFVQNENYVTGTFLTESGDYRYLEGIATGNELMLSCFDGAHAFLFKAKKEGENSLKGTFWSGNHWSEEWLGEKNDLFTLTHPDSITYLIDESIPFNFTFPNLNNEPVSLSDDLFKDKVVIVQIMGSWCPNCADESKDFAVLYDQYHADGLEIVAIAYERSDDLEKSKSRIAQFKKEVSADYTFLFGGKANKKENSKDFGILNGISSYPTAIFIDRSGKIRKIHTGYYGPGTGQFYFKYKEDTEMLIEKMLSESTSS